MVFPVLARPIPPQERRLVLAKADYSEFEWLDLVKDTHLS
jgi:hypothetical protein